MKAPDSLAHPTARPSRAGSEPARRVGHRRGREPGPLLLVVAGIHGNEPAGVLAARRFFERLERDAPPLRGDVVALLGNTRALARGVRYIDRDLNRGWSRDHLASSPTDGGPHSSEDLEQRELFDAIESARSLARGPVTFLDLHTTSADGIPFAMVGDAPRGRDFALHFPLPLLLGLLEQVDAPLLEYMRGLGCVTLGVEAGQNDRESSVLHHEAVLWIALVAAGLLRRDSVPEFARCRALLSRARRGLPHVMQVQRRHPITPQDRFLMQPGFANIQRVRAGELLARDRSGDIHADRDGILFMPLYQPQGDDGFFLGRAVHSFRLRFPALLRRMRDSR